MQIRITYIDLWQGHASRNHVLTSYPGSVPECYFCQFFLRPGADKFRVTTLSHVRQAIYITAPSKTMEWRIIWIRQTIDHF